MVNGSGRWVLQFRDMRYYREEQQKTTNSFIGSPRFYAQIYFDKVTINNDQSKNNPYQSVIVANIDDNQLGTFIDISH